MQILIVKDSSTKIPKDASAAEVERLIAAGFVVELVKPDNSVVQVPPGSSAAQIELQAHAFSEPAPEPQPIIEPIPAAHADMDETIQPVSDAEVDSTEKARSKA